MTPTDKDHATARAIVAPIAELLLDGDAATADLIAAAIAEARRETAEACAVAAGEACREVRREVRSREDERLDAGDEADMCAERAHAAILRAGGAL